MILSASLRLATPRAWARRDGHPHTPRRQPQGTGGIFAFPSLSGEGRQNPVCSCKFFLPVQQKTGYEQPLLCNLSLRLLGIRYTYYITYNIYQCEHEYIVLKRNKDFSPSWAFACSVWTQHFEIQRYKVGWGFFPGGEDEAIIIFPIFFPERMYFFKKKNASVVSSHTLFLFLPLQIFGGNKIESNYKNERKIWFVNWKNVNTCRKLYRHFLFHIFYEKSGHSEEVEMLFWSISVLSAHYFSTNTFSVKNCQSPFLLRSFCNSLSPSPYTAIWQLLGPQ